MSMSDQVISDVLQSMHKVDVPPHVGSDDLVEHLLPLGKSGNLTLVLGAGVSVPYGLPTWGKLIEALIGRFYPERTIIFDELLDKYFLHVSPLVLARYVKLHARYEDSVAEYVQRLLYLNLKTPSGATALGAIADLAIHCSLNGIRLSVITFNYDSLLEEEIARQDKHVSFDVVYDDRTFSEAHSLIRIYHVHGFLPRGEFSSNRSSGIILSEDEFHQIYSIPNHWSNVIQNSCYAQTGCVFVGLSFSDPNLRRLVDYMMLHRVFGRHFILSRPYSEGDAVFPNLTTTLSAEEAREINRFYLSLFRSMKISVVTTESYSEIPKIINRLRF